MLSPTFVDVGAARLFANRIQVETLDQLPHLMVSLRRIEPNPQPVGSPTGRTGSWLSTPDLYECITHGSGVYRIFASTLSPTQAHHPRAWQRPNPRPLLGHGKPDLLEAHNKSSSRLIP